MRKREFGISVILIVACLFAVCPALAQDADEDGFDFWLSEAYLRRIADENTILFRQNLSMNHRTRKVHTLKDDCEIHIAASSEETHAWPAGIVVEPPNLCKERAPGMSKQASETRLREELWPKYLDDHIMGRRCEVEGFPRIFTEHASGNTDPANPNHVLEVHPALRFVCSDFTLDMRSFLKVYPGMRQIKRESAAKCIEGRKLMVRAREGRFEFKEQGGGSCGNFAVFEVVVSREWVRRINGGHSAIARASPGGFGPYSLKIYTYEGTKEDELLEKILQGESVDRRLYFHGMFTYDYFSIVKTLRDRDGTWHNPDDWKEVRYPLALVVFGETTQSEED